MEKAAIYYRVSTSDQNVDGQLDELRAYAEKRGWAIEEFTDEGISGADRTRPALDQMMVGVKEGGSSTSCSYGRLTASPGRQRT